MSLYPVIADNRRTSTRTFAESKSALTWTKCATYSDSPRPTASVRSHSRRSKRHHASARHSRRSSRKPKTSRVSSHALLIKTRTSAWLGTWRHASACQSPLSSTRSFSRPCKAPSQRWVPPMPTRPSSSPILPSRSKTRSTNTRSVVADRPSKSTRRTAATVISMWAFSISSSSWTMTSVLRRSEGLVC